MSEKARVSWAKVSARRPAGIAFVAYARVLIPPGQAQPPQPQPRRVGPEMRPAGGPRVDFESLYKAEAHAARLAQEDEEIIHAIVTIVTSGILHEQTQELH